MTRAELIAAIDRLRRELEAAEEALAILDASQPELFGPGGAVYVDELVGICADAVALAEQRNFELPEWTQRPWFILNGASANTALSDEDRIDAGQNLSYAYFANQYLGSVNPHIAGSAEPRFIKFRAAADYQRHEGGGGFVARGTLTVGEDPIFVFPGSREDLITKVRAFADDIAENGMPVPTGAFTLGPR